MARPETHSARSQLLQNKVHLNGCINLHELAVEQGRLVAPLLYRIHCCLPKLVRPRNNLDLLHQAVFGDDHVQYHRTGYAL